MEEKKKMYKDFGGEMSQSVKVTRWGAPIHNQDESSYNMFMKYAKGDQGQNNSQYQKIQSRKVVEKESRIHQQGISQMVGLESGFRKFKNNQALALKELKQQYQILKNLPIEDRIPLTPKDPQSANSSIRDDNSVASSKQSKNQKRQPASRQAQLLSLEKKQLEIVIGNSMKKVEELLHNEMEYKKQIHELRLQLDGKGEEEKYQNTIRALKKNQAQSHDIIDSLKREVERLKNINKQQLQNINRLEAELSTKNQQLRKSLDERRKFDDIIRFQKDKHSNLEIEMRKIKMESQILEKQKNSQISRLNKLIEQKQVSFDRQMNSKIRRLQDQLQTKDKRYQLLLDQLQQVKRKEIQIEKSENQKQPDQVQDLKKLLLQALSGNRDDSKLKELLLKIDQLKQENRQLRNQLKSIQINPNDDIKKSQMFIETINAIFSKMDQSGKNSQDSLKKQIQSMKNHISSLKLAPDNVQKIRQQQSIIKEMQNIIDQENEIKSKFKEEIIHLRKQYNTIHQNHQKTKNRLAELLEKQLSYHREIAFLKNQLQAKKSYTFSSKEQLDNYKNTVNSLRTQNQTLKSINSNLRSEIETLKYSINNLKGQLDIVKANNIDMTASQNDFVNMKVKIISLEKLEQQNSKLYDEIQSYKDSIRKIQDDKDNQIRSLRKKIDEIELQYQKSKKQNLFNFDMQKSAHLAQIQRIKMDYNHLKVEKQNLKAQVQKCRIFYDQKINQRIREIDDLKRINQQNINIKNMQIQQIKASYIERNQGKISDIQQVKKSYEKQILLLNARHQESLAKTLKKLQALVDANEKFRIQSQRYIEIERQIIELRKVIKHTKSLNNGVDHLWQIKETQYGNINEIIRLLKCRQ